MQSHKGQNIQMKKCLNHYSQAGLVLHIISHLLDNLLKFVCVFYFWILTLESLLFVTWINSFLQQG
jgi:hypothetical protein